LSFDILQTVLGGKLRLYANLYNVVIWRGTFNSGEFRKWVLDLVREDQLFDQGIDEDGDVIGYYSEFTEAINPEKVAGTHYTLKDTGEFFESFFLTIYPDYFEINANPIKVNDDGETENLFYKYTESIIGLTSESKDKLGREILRRYRIELQKYLGI
tara:strand:+ start:120 stop:590 length:471 start_codon:yes stop_codon:yes gene_type:complete